MRVLRRTTRWLTLLLILFWSFFPIYLALNTSLMTQRAAQSTPARYIPNPLTGTNYRQLFGFVHAGAGGGSISAEFLRSLLNTVVEAGGAVLLTVPIALFAAYALARMRMRFKRLIFTAVLLTLAVPAYATLLPVYRLMINLGLLNSYLGIILIYASGILPLAVWILYNYVLTIPQQLEEAAAIDGASSIQSLMRIILPLAAPGIAATAIIVYLFAWAQFLFPLIMTTDLSAQPLTVVVAGLSGERVIPFTLLMAAAILAAAPAGLVALLLNRYIVSGLTSGGVK